MKSLSLPTLFYSFNDRPNWQICCAISNGEWWVRDYVSIHYCSRMLVHCAKLGIEARARVRGQKSNNLLLLNSFYNGINGRKEAR